ncbi:cupin domain-containing protein [Thermus islandicus]|uniref:cupin domain-containing protein n=1 Tax=Thermus islandicus TaxID=540988 RepID=UPI0003B4F4A5|nr:cupin domain-containing protein [Thermus islandicus]
MEVRRLRSTERGSPEWFSGAVLLAARPEGESLLLVRFAPGARTAWHAHPKGQVLYVTEGVGLAQSRGGWARLLLPGDVVVFAPGEEHWHGAFPDRFLVHLALQGGKNGLLGGEGAGGSLPGGPRGHPNFLEPSAKYPASRARAIMRSGV